jgi:hypothetical protein
MQSSQAIMQSIKGIINRSHGIDHDIQVQLSGLFHAYNATARAERVQSKIESGYAKVDALRRENADLERTLNDEREQNKRDYDRMYEESNTLRNSKAQLQVRADDLAREVETLRAGLLAIPGSYKAYSLSTSHEGSVNKIGAIKLYREIFLVGLADAKNAVESMMQTPKVVTLGEQAAKKLTDSKFFLVSPQA